MKLTVVAPVHNEEKNISVFYKRTKAVLGKITKSWEIIFVDDGSEDESLNKIKKIARQNKKVKALSFSRNFGHQAAITCGLNAAQGDAVVTIDTDLQDPPELIEKMVGEWKKGAEVVYAKRKSRNDNFLKRATASMFYRLLSLMSETSIPVDVGDFRLMDWRTVEAMRGLREHSRFMRGLSSWVGFKQVAVEFNRDKRSFGKTNYPYRKMLRLALDGIFSFSQKPLKLASWLGFLTTLAGFLYALYAIYLKIFRPEIVVQGWTSLAVVILVIGGIQLIILGVIGEYLGRVYTETQSRPLYIISKKINIK